MTKQARSTNVRNGASARAFAFGLRSLDHSFVIRISCFSDFWLWLLRRFPRWHLLAAAVLLFAMSGCFRWCDCQGDQGEALDPVPSAEDVQPEPSPFQPERPEPLRPREQPRWQGQPKPTADEDDRSAAATPPAPPSGQPLAARLTSTSSVESSSPKSTSHQPLKDESYRLHPPPHPELADPGSNFTGAKVFVWQQGCPIGERLLADLKANRIGWTCGPGPEYDFWEVRVPATEWCPIIRYYDRGRLLPGAVRGYCGPQQLPAIYAKHPHTNEDVEQWRSDAAPAGLAASGQQMPPVYGQPVYAPVYRSAPIQRPPCGPYIGGVYDSHTKVGLNLGFGF